MPSCTALDEVLSAESVLRWTEKRTTESSASESNQIHRTLGVYRSIVPKVVGEL